ncbi:hypothetical protein F2Q69_00041958 [Brassica cretica]|uniref:Uncharacterized protein n=1 Tax=Brassica cretica TaxID=69181 RepID=A0A8S9NBF1_BRACR|nr:hypothetical protein F2Q69_00041958 [Brassica cretica]
MEQMASRSDVELEVEAALMLQPEGLGASAVAAFEEEEAAEAHRSTSDEWESERQKLRFLIKHFPEPEKPHDNSLPAAASLELFIAGNVQLIGDLLPVISEPSTLFSPPFLGNPPLVSRRGGLNGLCSAVEELFP